MARTKTVTVGGTDYQLQSVTYSWYSNLTDLYINPANGRKNTAKYVDALIKGCVTAPAEVAKGGLKYFDEQDDLATPSELVREIENFLAERNKSKDRKAPSAEQRASVEDGLLHERHQLLRAEGYGPVRLRRS